MFCAEIGSNHNQDWNRCENLIRSAASIGCHAVKFQLFTAEKLYKQKALEKMKKTGKYDELKKSELPIEFIPKIHELCRNLEIEFGCTPFDIESAKYLKQYIDFYKISSFDILREDLIRYCASTEKIIKISLGMINVTYNMIMNCDVVKGIQKIDLKIFSNVIKWCGENKPHLYFCVSKYPATVEFFNYNQMDLIGHLGYGEQNKFITGWSDHTKDVGVIIAAYMTNHDIEFHFDLDDMAGNESKYGHVWSVTEAKKFIEPICSFEKIRRPLCVTKYHPPIHLAADPIDGLRSYE